MDSPTVQCKPSSNAVINFWYWPVTGPSPSLFQPSDNDIGGTLDLVMWQPYLNFTMQSIIRKRRKATTMLYMYLWCKVQTVCPQLVGGMSLLSFALNAGSILICNKHENNQKLLSLTYKWCPKIEAGLSEPGFPPCTACSKCLSVSVNVVFVLVEWTMKSHLLLFMVHNKCDCGPWGPFLSTDRWQKLGWS